MQYRRGSFQILFFGEYGDKLKKETANSHTAAKTIETEYLIKNKNHSIVINRTISNSKDNDNKWDYIP